MKASPVFKDAFRIALSDRKSLLWHVGILFAGPAALILTWPEEGLSRFLEIGDGPDVFRAVAAACSLVLYVAAGGWTFGTSFGKQPHSFERWNRYASVGGGSYLIGRIFYHAAHSALLAAMILPSLTAASAGALLPPEQAVLSAVLIFWFVFCLRCTVEGGRRPDGNSGSAGMSIYVVALMPYLVLTASSLPEWSVLHAVRFPDGPASWRSAVLHAGFAAAGLGIAAFRVRSSEKTVRRP